MKDMRICESTFPLENGGFGKVAVFIYSGSGEPRANLDYAVRQYVGDYENYTELIDSQLNCPWVRVIVSDINDMSQVTFEQFMRDIKLDKLME